MHEWRSMFHITWDGKYHVVFTPKYREKAIFGQLRQKKDCEMRDWE